MVRKTRNERDLEYGHPVVKTLPVTAGSLVTRRHSAKSGCFSLLEKA